MFLCALVIGQARNHAAHSYPIGDSPVFKDFQVVKDSPYKKLWDDALKLPKTYDWVDRMNDLRTLCNANPNDPVLAYKHGLAVLYCSHKYKGNTVAELMYEATYFMVRPSKNPRDIEYTKVAYINGTWIYHIVKDPCSLRMLQAFPEDRLIRLSAGLMVGASPDAKNRLIGYKILKEEFDKSPSMMTSYRLTFVVVQDAWHTKDKAKAANAIKMIDVHVSTYPEDDNTVMIKQRKTMENIVNGVKNPGVLPPPKGSGSG